jgi:CelD/BcsL family acetyltransferase involved in cellulose biosynthesis
VEHEENIRPGPLVVQRLDARALAQVDAAQWDALSAHTLVENPFYARQYVLAGLRTIDRNAPLEALAVRGPGGDLFGLFPYQRRRFPFANADGACNVYQPTCTPLVHRDHAAAVVEAWLDVMLGSGGVPRLWQLRHVDLDSQLTALLDAALARRGLRSVAVNTYQRPRLTRLEGGLDRHLDVVLSKSRLKDLQRNLRRLGESGTVRFERACAPDLVARRFEQFLAMENAGWKGESGTAILARSNDADFARAAFMPRDGQPGTVSIDTLLLDERPIALSINMRVRDTAFTPKCTYDENYRRFSPGFLLEYFVIGAFYAGDGASEMDACTTSDGHVIAGFWNGAKRIGTLVVGPDTWQTPALALSAEATHAVREHLKTALRRLPLRRWAKSLAAARAPKVGWHVPWTAALAAAITVAALYAE